MNLRSYRSAVATFLIIGIPGFGAGLSTLCFGKSESIDSTTVENLPKSDSGFSVRIQGGPSAFDPQAKKKAQDIWSDTLDGTQWELGGLYKFSDIPLAMGLVMQRQAFKDCASLEFFRTCDQATNCRFGLQTQYVGQLTSQLGWHVGATYFGYSVGNIDSNTHGYSSVEHADDTYGPGEELTDTGTIHFRTKGYAANIGTKYRFNGTPFSLTADFAWGRESITYEQFAYESVGNRGTYIYLTGNVKDFVDRANPDQSGDGDSADSASILEFKTIESTSLMAGIEMLIW